MEDLKIEFFEISKLFRDLLRVFIQRINERVDENQRITHEQFVFLYSINKKESEVIQKDMAEFLNKDKSVIFRMIDTLEDKNLIRRVVDKNDRRKNLLMVTKTGKNLINNYKSIGLEIVEQIHQGIDEVNLEVFYNVVQQLKANTSRL